MPSEKDNKIKMIVTWEGERTKWYGACKIALKNLTDSALVNPEIQFTIPDGSNYNADLG